MPAVAAAKGATMTTPSDIGRYYGDPDDLLYVGPSSPAGGDLTDPEARYGRLTPLVLRLAGAFAGVPLGFLNAPDAVAATSLRDIPPGAMSATIQVQGGPIRYTFDGTPPTAVLGHRADVGTILQVAMPATLQGFQWIRETATVTGLAITYWS